MNQQSGAKCRHPPKPLNDVRANDEGERSERRAKAAIIVGWVVAGSHVLPICMMGVMPGMEWGCSLCDELFDKLADLVSGLLSGGG